MELFERAHFAISKKNLKTAKSEETKKQLKLMLRGYKESDNELIKIAPDTHFEEDDSSISCFSDLNLTNSLSDGSSAAAGVIEANYNATSDINELTLSDSSLIYSSESQSQYVNKHFFNKSIDSSDTSDKSSLNASISDHLNTDCSSDTEDSMPFDDNGALASKILDRLEAVKHTKIKINVLSSLSSDTSSIEMVMTDKEDISKSQNDKNTQILDKISLNNLNVPFKQDKKNNNSIAVKVSQILNQNTLSYLPREKLTEESVNDSSENRSLYVTIEATDMLNQRLNDILGEYKYTTIKNIPFYSDSNNTFSIQSNDISNESLLSRMDIDKDEKAILENIKPSMTQEVVDLDKSHNEPEMLKQRERSSKSVTDIIVPINIYNKKNKCVFVLKHPAIVYIHGKVKVELLAGSVEIFGYSLQNKPCEIYAPNYNCAYYLRTLENENSYYGLFSKLTSVGLSVSEAEEIVTTINSHDSVISMKKLDDRKMDFVENSFSRVDLFRKHSKNIASDLIESSNILGCSLCLSPWRCYEEIPSWKQTLKCGFNRYSKGIVCGGKGVGKTTFLRYYVNKMLNQGPVLVIDLDPGQCEFTVAGNISATIVNEPLLGPNFTHLKTPEKMLSLGMINTMDNPKRYINAVKQLISYCNTEERFQTMPWIINTMGMTNTMGLKFILFTIILLKPTFLIQIDSKAPKKRYDFYLTAQNVVNCFNNLRYDWMFRGLLDYLHLDYTFIVSHHMDSTNKNNFSLAPREERYLNFLAYFGELMNIYDGISLLGITPYEVSLKDLKIGLNVKINEDMVTKVVNGKIVALCQCNINHDNRNKMFLLADDPIVCYGQGLVRGVDYTRGILYIITPLPADELVLVNTLVYADWVPELLGQEKSLPSGLAVPYRTDTMYQQRQLMFAPRRRFNPLLLLKMSRKLKND